MVTTILSSPGAAHADDSTLTIQAVAAERERDYDKALQLWRHMARTKPSALASAGEAKILWMLNRRDEAKTALDAALKCNPKFSPALSLLAKIQLSEGDADAAKKNLDAAVQSDATNIEAQRLLADLLAHAGRLDEAYKHYERLVELAPGNIHARLNVIAYLASHGQLDKAIEVCSNGIVVSDPPQKLRLELGHLYLQSGKFADAYDAFRAALVADSRDTEADQMLAITCGARGDWVSAAAYAKSFADVDLDSINATILTAWAAYLSGDLLEAKTQFEHAIELAPDDADLRNLQAIVLMDLRRFPAASQQLLDASKSAPDNVYVKLNTAMLQLLSGKLADGLDTAEKIVHEYPSLNAAKSLYAYANVLNNKPAEAGRLAQQVLKQDWDDVLAHIVSARVLRSDGSFTEALRHLQDAQRTAGSASAFIQCEIANTMLEQGNTTGAATAAQRALQFAPANLEAKTALAHALAKIGNWDGAVLYLREMANRNPKDLPAKLELGEALLKQGDLVAAELVYESARRLAPHSMQVLMGLSEVAERQGNKRLSKKFHKQAQAIRARKD